MASRKQKVTAASWFRTAFGGNGKKRGKDDALDSYREILRMVKKGG